MELNQEEKQVLKNLLIKLVAGSSLKTIASSSDEDAQKQYFDPFLLSWGLKSSALRGSLLKKINSDFAEEVFSELKTSQEWAQDYVSEFVVWDPDGWDRQNYDFSWKQELITREEFLKRVANSTCIGGIKQDA